MKILSSMQKFVIPLISASLGLVACSGADQSAESTAEAELEINLNPATLDEAGESLARIAARQKLNPADAIAKDALEALAPRLDELNHLVARIEPEPGRVVSFYEMEPGSIGISERGLAGSTPLISAKLRALPAVDLYRRLAAKEAPEALLRAQERALLTHDLRSANEEAGPIGASTSFTKPIAAQAAPGTLQQPLTEADGPWFAEHICYQAWHPKDSRACLPNWGGGGWAQAKTTVSDFIVAPYTGDWLNVRMQYSSITKFTDVVYPCQFYGAWYHSASSGGEYLLRTHRWDVLQAAGDGFHLAYAFNWTCQGIYNCNLGH